MHTITITRKELENFLEEVPKAGDTAKFSWNKNRAWPSNDEGYNHPTLKKIFKHLHDTYYKEHSSTPMFTITDHCVQKVAYDKA